MFNKISPYNNGSKILGSVLKRDKTLYTWLIPQAYNIENRIFVFAKHGNCFVSGSRKYMSPLCSNLKTKKSYITNEKNLQANIQLKDFLKNYNTEKLLNNYKILNKNQNYKLFQESKKVEEYKAQSQQHTNKALKKQAVLNKAALRIHNEEAQNSSVALLKTSLSAPQLLPFGKQRSKHVPTGPGLKLDILAVNKPLLYKKLGHLEAIFFKKTAFRHDDFKKKTTALLQDKGNKTQLDMAVLTKNQQTRKNLSSESKAKNFFDKIQLSQTTSNYFLLQPQALSCYPLVRRSDLKKSSQPYFKNSEHVSLKTRRYLSYKRTYNFLQSLLTKYLETKPVNINYQFKDQKLDYLSGDLFLTMLFLKEDLLRLKKTAAAPQPDCSSARSTMQLRSNSNSGVDDQFFYQIKKSACFIVPSIFSKTRLLKKATVPQKEAGNHKISFFQACVHRNNFNKTFLIYWLIPITGFACTLINNNGFTLFSNVNHLNISSWLPNQVLKLDLKNSNYKNNFLQIRTTFNNLYFQIVYKANSYNTLLNKVFPTTSSSGFALLLKKAKQSYKTATVFSSVSKSFSISSKKNLPDNPIYNSSLWLSKYYNFGNSFPEGSKKHVFLQKNELTACFGQAATDFTQLKNFFSRQPKNSFVIQPLNKVQVLNNTLNFVKSKESLYLLKLKILKLKKFYVKAAKQPLGSKFIFVTPLTSYTKGCQSALRAITYLNDIQRLILTKQLLFTGTKINDQPDLNAQKKFLSLNLRNVQKNPVENKTKFLSYFLEKHKNKISKNGFQYVTKLTTKASKQGQAVNYFVIVKNTTQDRSFRERNINRLFSGYAAVQRLSEEKQLKSVLNIDQAALKSNYIYSSTAKNENKKKDPQKKLTIFNNLQDILKIKKHLLSVKTSKYKLPNNVLSILFEQQKMFKKTTENLKNLIQNQKKRRAKKQKLETRRQKKRTRFFPRPIWLRNRLFLNKVNKRKLTSFNPLSTDKKNKIDLTWQAASKNQVHFYRLKIPKMFHGTSRLRGSTAARLKNRFFEKTYYFPLINNNTKSNSYLASRSEAIQSRRVLTKKNVLSSKLLNTSLKNNILRFLLEITKNKVSCEDKTGILRKLRWPSSEYTMGNFSFSQTCKQAYRPEDSSVALINTVINQQLAGNKITAAAEKASLAAPELLLLEGQQEKKRLNTQIKLHNVKINKNYYNFNEEKTNNTQVNQKQKNIPYINFWIWAYNSTTDNTKPFFIWLLPTSVKEAVKVRQLAYATSLNFKKHRTALRAILRIHWALNKTNTNTITDYTKRYNLWATQKLRNQSKNNKTKYIEKQFITNWTTVNLFPIYTVPHLQEDGRQIKKKELQYLNLSLFSKKIKTKLREKKQKLDYLTTIFFNYKRMTSGDTAAVFLNKSLKLKEFQIFKNGNMLHCYPEGSRTTRFKNFLITPSQQLKSSLANTTLKKEYFLMSCCLLLHFCALISLVSISQVRCFIKFHVILLTKLSNLYSTLIQNIVKKLLINFNFIKTGKIFPTRIKPSTFYPQQSILPTDDLATALQKKASKPLIKKRKSELLGQRPVFSLGTKKRLQSTLRKKDLKLALIKSKDYQKWSPFKKENLETGQSFALRAIKIDAVSLKITEGWEEKKMGRTALRAIDQQVDTLLLQTQAFSNATRLPGEQQDSFALFYKAKPESLYFNMFSKFNVVKSNINLISFFSQLPGRQQLLRSKNRKTLDLLPVFRASLKNREEAKNFKFEYKINVIKQKINGFSKDYKNKILRLVFKVINIFQTIVRTISAFFEKPVEFTTTWIAFGFLVEWSSDFITIIPENIDSYIWSTFSKTVRIIPIKLFFDLNTEALMTSHLSKNVLIDTLLGVGVTISFLESPVKSNFAAMQLLPFDQNKAASAVLFKDNWHNFLILTVSYLFQRRILFLFSTLKDSLNQPDTDLILRQQKGTLFWDIWADFLVTAAEYYNVNVAALSAIKSEQNKLIEKLSKAPASFWFDQEFVQDKSFTLQQPLAALLPGGLHEKKRFDNSKTQSKKRKRSLGIYSWLNPFLIKKSGSALNSYKTGQDKFPNFFKKPEIYGVSKTANKKRVQSSKKKKDSDLLVQASPTQQSKMHDMQNQQHFLFNNKPLAFIKQSKKINKDQRNFADRWTVNQFITYQTYKNFNNSNSDLFIDFHTPKTFLQIPTVKYNTILQQPIGILVCQIYSGLFTKQNSKNILLVKTESTDYSVLLIQALAGETELKIITDNAHRYALVNRGFAIGIKLLRDVFFAIALNTPCIFLLEDLHAIGERRPMLISDFGEQQMSEGSFAKTSNFITTGKQEVHEKNQVVYQLTRHKITDYKKPFKGDYSLTIPTNLYSLDLFLKPAFGRPTQSTSNLSLISHNNLTEKNKINLTKENKKISAYTGAQTGFITVKKMKKNYLTPPSTSPFSLLILKEEKKLKPNKIVEEISWAGLPYRVDETKLRTSYSVRAKVAMLAELSLSNISAKLDMITDLLVIIDSVRSNKGFVVFATTNLPHVLDPALRRPGRFDETIYLQAGGLLPSLKKKETLQRTPRDQNTKQAVAFNSCEISEVSLWETMEIKTSTSLAAFLKCPEIHPLFAQAVTSFSLPASIARSASLDLINKKTGKYILPSAFNFALRATVNFKDFDTILTLKNRVFSGSPQSSSAASVASREQKFLFAKQPQEIFNNNTCLSNSQTALISYTKKLKHKKSKTHIKQLINLVSTGNYKKAVAVNKITARQFNTQPEAGNFTTKETNLSCFVNKEKQAALRAITYYLVGKIMLTDYLNKCHFFKFTSPKQSPKALYLNIKSINYLSLFGLKNKIILQLMSIFGGKIGQYLSQPLNDSNLPLVYKTFLKNVATPQRLHKMYNFTGTNNSIHPFNEQKLLKYLRDVDSQKRLNRQNILEIFDGNDNSIQLATSLMLSFIHKRYLYLKNLIVPKLLSFTDGMILEEPPCPPFSNLLIPAKRFENYKRVFHDSFVGDTQGHRKGEISLFEKQSYYTQLNKIKELNRTKTETFAQQSAREWHKPNAENLRNGRRPNSNKDRPTAVSLFEKALERTTNINWYYQNLIIKRHGQYLTNQWWNGQLSEHNPETVFLSDIDWRSSFIKKSVNTSREKILSKSALNNFSSSFETTQRYFDILLDFPDTEQYYNPHRRRWLLNKGYWSFWFNFDKVYSEEIVTTWVLESIIQTYLYLHNNTEFLDYVVSKFIGVGLPLSVSIGETSTSSVFEYSKTEISSINEILFITSFKRFN